MVVSALRVPLVDIQAQYRLLMPEIMAACADVLASMQLYLGPQQQRFEQAFARYCGCEYGVGVANGTDALVLALRACEIGPGDEVITVANTFIATVEAIVAVGATPVFVDVDPETYLMDWRQLEQVLTLRTRAVLPVHLYGHAVEMQPVLDFARSHGLCVIEDASQAHGATYQGQRVGSLGDIACFSLYCSKNLGALGEAGICTTNDAYLAERIRLLRDHGSCTRYRHEIMGYNSRMDELQAAVLNVKLPYLEEWNRIRQQHAQQYSEQLRSIAAAVPLVRSWATHVYCYYVIQTVDRTGLQQALLADGIGAQIHYPTPIHLQPACACYGYRRGMLPVTEQLATKIISLPMYPELTEQQIQLVINSVKKHVTERALRSCE